jgi:hypothetical protein
MPMGDAQAQATTFGRGSNVLEYWLAHAEGFDVSPETSAGGRVERVLVDPVQRRVEGVLVRSSRLRRRRMFPVDAFTAVDPFARVLHLEEELRADATRSPLAAELARLGRRFRLGISAAVAWSLPRLRANLGAAGIAVLAWAAGVADVTRRLWARLFAQRRATGPT